MRVVCEDRSGVCRGSHARAGLVWLTTMTISSSTAKDEADGVMPEQGQEEQQGVTLHSASNLSQKARIRRASALVVWKSSISGTLGADRAGRS